MKIVFFLFCFNFFVLLSKCEDNFFFHFEGVKKETVEKAEEFCLKKNRWLLEIYDEKMEKDFEEFRKKVKELWEGEVWINLGYGDPEWKWLRKNSRVEASGYDVNEMRVGAIKKNEIIGMELIKSPMNMLLSNWLCEIKKPPFNQKRIIPRSGFKKSWFEAQNDCVKIGGFLAELDQEEFSKLKFSLKKSVYYFVGLARWPSVWNFKGTLVFYSNWYKGFIPEWDLNLSKCGYLVQNSSKWNNQNCGGKKHVVCLSKKEEVEKKDEPVFPSDEKKEGRDHFIVLITFGSIFFIFVLTPWVVKFFLFIKKKVKTKRNENGNKSFDKNNETLLHEKKQIRNEINSSICDLKSQNFKTSIESFLDEIKKTKNEIKSSLDELKSQKKINPSLNNLKIQSFKTINESSIDQMKN